MEFEPDSHVREGDFWPYYAPNPLRAGATKGADADFAPRLRDFAGHVEGLSAFGGENLDEQLGIA
jgi:hypothetical protein